MSIGILEEAPGKLLSEQEIQEISRKPTEAEENLGGKVDALISYYLSLNPKIKTGEIKTEIRRILEGDNQFDPTRGGGIMLDQILGIHGKPLNISGK